MKRTKLQLTRISVQNMSQQQMATIRGGGGNTLNLGCNTQECSADVCPTDTCGPSVHPKACVTLEC